MWKVKNHTTVQGSASSLPSAPSPHIPFPPPAPVSIPLLPPVDNVVLMKVLQALEDLQDDALHLEIKDRSNTPCKSSSSQASPQGLNPLRYPVVCHICHCSAVCQSPHPSRAANRLSGGTFSPHCFTASLLQPKTQSGKSLEHSVRASKAQAPHMAQESWLTQCSPALLKPSTRSRESTPVHTVFWLEW